MDLYSLQRDPNIWGLNAGEFRPERWSKVWPLWESNWQYEPFLGGSRMCPAQNQVISQLSCLLVRVAQNIQAVENRNSVWKYEENIKMTIESRNGVKIALVPVQHPMDEKDTRHGKSMLRCIDLETMMSSAIKLRAFQNKRHFIYVPISLAVDEEDRAPEANTRVHYCFVSRLLVYSRSLYQGARPVANRGSVSD